MDWATKYRPAKVREVVGNPQSIAVMVDWARNWSNKNRPLILYGKPGTGKTSSAYALVNDMGWDIVDLNASDQRTAGIIEKIAGEGSTSASITGRKHKLILLDEADNLQGSADRGGAKAIIELIDGSQQPIILIANDLYGISADIRKRCIPVQFIQLQSRSLVPHLKHICNLESVLCDNEALKEIAHDSGGDVRAAINMLYASSIGKDTLEPKDLLSSEKDERNTKFSLMLSLFSGKEGMNLLTKSKSVNETPDKIILWIESSLNYYNDIEIISEAYEGLTRADEYLGYTYRKQYYKLWSYAFANMLLRVNIAIKKSSFHPKIVPPDRWQKISKAKYQKELRGNMIGKFSETFHMSESDVRDEYLDIFARLFELSPQSFIDTLSFSPDELIVLLEDKKLVSEIIAKLPEITKKGQYSDKVEKKKILVPKKTAKNKELKVEESSSIKDEIPMKTEKEGQVSLPQKTLFDTY